MALQEVLLTWQVITQVDAAPCANRQCCTEGPHDSVTKDVNLHSTTEHTSAEQAVMVTCGKR
jgi:hypothetical protein